MYEEFFKGIMFGLEAAMPVTEPLFATPHDIILENEAFQLLKFGENRSKRSPILILTPQAGHHSSICDFSESNSLVRTLLNNTSKTVYAIKYKSATIFRSHETILSLLMQTNECVETIGGMAHLIGLCQGGWQAVLYAALYPEKCLTLTVAGAPIDTHAGISKIQTALEYIPFETYRSIVNLHGGIWPGWYQLLSFKLMNPTDRFLIDYLKIFSFIDENDEEKLMRDRRFRNWYNYTQNLAGGWFLEAIKSIFYDNCLDLMADLTKITCPIVMIAGKKDDITLPEQVYGLSKVVSSHFKYIYEVDSGHIGLFMGSNALETIWPAVAKDIYLN